MHVGYKRWIKQGVHNDVCRYAVIVVFVDVCCKWVTFVDVCRYAVGNRMWVTFLHWEPILVTREATCGTPTSMFIVAWYIFTRGALFRS